MTNIEFVNKGFFLLFLIYIPLIIWYLWRYKRSVASMNISSIQAFEKVKTPIRAWLRHLLFVLRLAVIGLIIVVLARPQSYDKWEESKTNGVDICIALDVSGSMLAEDFKPNRIEAAKTIGQEFVSSRPEDRLGLVVFSGEAYTQCPLTIDHAQLINLFSQVKSGLIEDGTAIGMGLATAVNRIKNSKAVSRVIILLTDGVNNMGEISPMAASEFAKKYGIRVYTIGIGKNGMAPYPFQTNFGIQYQNVEVQIDEAILQNIAEQTGGKYFRATNNDKLREIYKEIDTMEKTILEVKSFSRPKEEFLPFLLLAFSILFLELLLKFTVFKNTF
ncbi:MAG: VWA domain-containing protein [Bacteroidales bacterium]|nr:VWA domain-containing protein [Bacteroidales bacterium]